jgi:hypothetical protein
MELEVDPKMERKDFSGQPRTADGLVVLIARV